MLSSDIIFIALFIGAHSSSLSKIILTQKTIQFVEFPVLVPDLLYVTVCYWLKSVDTTNRQSTFSYAAPNDPLAITTWIEPTIFGTQIRMAISGLEVYSVNYPIEIHHWYHMCHSWEGRSARWLLYIDGDLVGKGTDGFIRPRIITGGGIPVFGQQQNNFDLSADRPGGFQSSAGVEGEMTMLLFDSRPLRHSVTSLGASGNADGEILGTKLTSDIAALAWGFKELGPSCLEQPLGNIVAWGVSPIKLFGNVVVSNAKLSCGDF